MPRSNLGLSFKKRTLHLPCMLLPFPFSLYRRRWKKGYSAAHYFPGRCIDMLCMRRVKKDRMYSATTFRHFRRPIGHFDICTNFCIKMEARSRERLHAHARGRPVPPLVSCQNKMTGECHAENKHGRCLFSARYFPAILFGQLTGSGRLWLPLFGKNGVASAPHATFLFSCM